MLVELFDDLTCLQFPNNYLCVFSCACNKPIAFTDVYVSNIVKVTVQRRLQSQSLSVPDLDDAKMHIVNSILMKNETYPSSAPLTIKRPVWSN